MPDPRTPATRYGVTRQEQRVTGFPCPTCGTLIPITIQDLLSRRSFRCRGTGCGALLRLDARGSSTALAALRTFNDRLQEIESSTAAPSRRPPAGRPA